ncbi:MAG: AAA family ATPase [Planctomycetes bacterium]|nr:AAA family ATPase [Planctomycetota bacterium]
MGKPIDKLTIKGFKSIRCLEDFELKNLNILVGANGAGKSNFVNFFELFRRAFEDDKFKRKVLESYVEKQGGGDQYFYLGPKFTRSINVQIDCAEMYQFNMSLSPGTGGELLCTFNTVAETAGLHEEEVLGYLNELEGGVIRDWVVYHFHDTTALAEVRREHYKRNNEYLRADAGNLAAFLLRIRKKSPETYQKIREVVQLAAPFFDDFLLREDEDGDDILLEWRQKHTDFLFGPNQLSDGTLRFICLATALLQPDAPKIMLFDEPELGLHPYALTLLAEMFKKASHQTQIIVSTQSATLIDHFQPADIIVVERDKGESVFKRLNAEKLKDWLEDYSLGELWQKNIFGGRPGHE